MSCRLCPVWVCWVAGTRTVVALAPADNGKDGAHHRAGDRDLAIWKVTAGEWRAHPRRFSFSVMQASPAGQWRLKDWRRIATRYDRCPKVFLSAIALAATVVFWL
jgi:transposase